MKFLKNLDEKYEKFVYNIKKYYPYKYFEIN
jgi:hypothetical protein